MIRRATFLLTLLAFTPYVPVAGRGVTVQGLTCGLRSAPTAPPGLPAALASASCIEIEASAA